MNRCIESSLDMGGRFAGAPASGARELSAVSVGGRWPSTLSQQVCRHRHGVQAGCSRSAGRSAGPLCPELGKLRRRLPSGSGSRVHAGGQEQSCTTRAGPTTTCLCGVRGRTPCVTVGSQLEPHWCRQRQGDPLPLDTRWRTWLPDPL